MRAQRQTRCEGFMPILTRRALCRDRTSMTLSEIITLSKELLEIVERVKANKHSARELNRRVQRLVAPLQKWTAAQAQKKVCYRL